MYAESADDEAETAVSDLTDDDNTMATEEILDELEHWRLDVIYDETDAVLATLGLSEDEENAMFEKLKMYRYVRGIEELKTGGHLRYISRSDKWLVPRSTIFCRVNEKTADGCTWLVCKNYGFGARHFQICMEKYLVFQKFTPDQLILINTMELLE